jgi:hypothetical protein
MSADRLGRPIDLTLSLVWRAKFRCAPPRTHLIAGNTPILAAGFRKLGHGDLQENLAGRTADPRSVLNVRHAVVSKASRQLLRPSDSWSPAAIEREG